MPIFQAMNNTNVFKYGSVVVMLAALLSGCSGSKNNDDTADDGPPPSREWVLFWSDEFNGTELDLANWEVQIGDGRVEGLQGWGNGEEQYYTEEAVTVRDGNLVITSQAGGPMVIDPAFGFESSYDYTSGRIRTQGLFDFTFGRVEARIKMPDTLGIWNAFWLLGSDPSPYGGWAAKGEIDIVETWQRGNPSTGSQPFASGAAHFGGPFPYNTFTSKALAPFIFSDDYHIYAVEWDAEEIRWFIDGENFFSLRADNYWNYYQDAVNGFTAGDENAPFDTNFHIILNAAVGGTLPQSANELPDPVNLFGEMLVDYVRVYKCPFDEENGTGCKNQADQAEDFLAFEFPVNDAFSAELDLYIDGPGPESIPVGRALALEVDNGLTFTEETEGGNTYIDITAPALGPGAIPTLNIVDAAADEFILAGFTPNGLGDIKFDLYIESFQPSPGILRVSMVSGVTENRSGVSLSLSDYPVGEWTRVTIPIQDILTNGPDSIDVGRITDFFRFELANAEIRLDNIQFACGPNVCGIVDEVPVFTDFVDPVWDRGIVGNDSIAISQGNADYTTPTGQHVEWRIFDTGEVNHDTVVETTFGTTGANGAVNFVGVDGTVPSIAALTGGEFSFDIRMIRNPNDVELLFKVDADGSTTGEQPLGNLPIGTWRTFTCPIATLSAQGLDVSRISAPFVLVPGNQGAGQDIVVQWDNVTFRPIQTGSATELNLPLIFDTLPGFCLPIQPFAGGAFGIVDNPGPDAVNSNTRVGRIQKFDPGIDQLFGGVANQLTNPIVFGNATQSTGKAFTIKTYSSRVGMPVVFKLESSPGVGPGRVFETTVANAWEEFEIDFNGEGTQTYPTITLILDDGVRGDGGPDFTLFIDEITQIDPTSTLADLTTTYNFDEPNTVYPLTDFGEARSSVSTGPAGSNGLVGQVVLNDFAASVAGTTLGGSEGFAVPIPNPAPPLCPIDPSGETVLLRIGARVHTPSAGTTVLFKVEDAIDAAQAAEDTVISTVGGWEDMEFEFCVRPMDTFEKLVIIFDAARPHNGETYYWDDIRVLP